MATVIDYALMAGNVYQDTRAPINWIPAPTNWRELEHVVNKDSGFEVSQFQNGTEIVISFAGTATAVDWWANVGGAFGVTSTQLQQAADYYLQIKATAPAGTTISFTGHSLGGGLASLMAVMFNETAVTFDQAPFRSSATAAVASELMTYLSGKGYGTQDLQGLNNFINAAASGGIPNESNVLDFNVQGEALGYTTVNANSSLDLYDFATHSVEFTDQISANDSFYQDDQKAA
ncbi:MAG: Mbeg1-like protein [Gallionella sp.]|jgi:putative lipase involved disintegration of autophagic bodies